MGVNTPLEVLECVYQNYATQKVKWVKEEYQVTYMSDEYEDLVGDYPGLNYSPSPGPVGFGPTPMVYTERVIGCCLVGGVAVCLNVRNATAERSMPIKFVAQAIRERTGSGKKADDGTVMDWNDDPETTEADVMAVLRRAKELAEAGLQ